MSESQQTDKGSCNRIEDSLICHHLMHGEIKSKSFDFSFLDSLCVVDLIYQHGFSIWKVDP